MLVGALVVGEKDEILVITSAGSVMRTEVKEIRETGRDTMGVRLVDLESETHVVSLTRVADTDCSVSNSSLNLGCMSLSGSLRRP